MSCSLLTMSCTHPTHAYRMYQPLCVHAHSSPISPHKRMIIKFMSESFKLCLMLMVVGYDAISLLILHNDIKYGFRPLSCDGILSWNPYYAWFVRRKERGSR